jgi:hypothetical protein
MAVANYSAANVQVVVGVDIIADPSEGVFCKATRDKENFVPVVGSTGNVARAKNLNVMGKIMLTVQQTGVANDKLSALAETGEVFPAQISDSGGTLQVFSAEAWIEKPADLELADVISKREWTLVCADITILGGSSTI